MNSPQNKDPAAGSAVSTGPSLPVRILKIVLSFSFLFLSLEAGSVRGNLVSAALGEGDSVISFGYLITGLVRSILGLLFFLLLGGKKWLHYIKGSIAHAWKFALPLIIFHTVVGGLVIESLFVPKSLGGSGGEIAAYALEHIVLSVAIMLLVGINEEVIFRGLGLGGMLLVFGHKKNGALWSVLLMSLIFGFVHVIYEIDITDPITIFIGLLKTLQTAMIGIILSCCIMTDQTLLGAMTVHAFCDWIIMVGELLIKQDRISHAAADRYAPDRCGGRHFHRHHADLSPAHDQGHQDPPRHAADERALRSPGCSSARIRCRMNILLHEAEIVPH